MWPTMRKAVLATGTLLLFTAGTAHASTSPILVARVPFAFVVNGHNFPAGTYTLERDDASSSVVVLRGESHTHAAEFVATVPDGGHDPAGSQPVLTFERQGSQYRLTSIWQSTNNGWDVARR